MRNNINNHEGPITLKILKNSSIIDRHNYEESMKTILGNDKTQLSLADFKTILSHIFGEKDVMIRSSKEATLIHENDNYKCIYGNDKSTNKSAKDTYKSENMFLSKIILNYLNNPNTKTIDSDLKELCAKLNYIEVGATIDIARLLQQKTSPSILGTITEQIKDYCLQGSKLEVRLNR